MSGMLARWSSSPDPPCLIQSLNELLRRPLHDCETAELERRMGHAEMDSG